MKVQHFYRLVPALCKEAATVKMTYRLVSEQQVTRYQRETYRKTQQRLTTLWTRYDNNEIRTSDFLKRISNLYAPSIPVPNHEEVDTDTDSDSD